MAKSAALRQSVGFAPKNYDQLPKEIYQSLFFSTTSGEAHNNPSRKAGASIVANCRPSSLQKIHDPQSGKYERYKSPLITRNACEYARQFVTRPLEGVELNAQLFTLNKEKSGGTKARKAMPMKGESETTHAYKGYSHDQAFKAIPENYKPAQERHTDPQSKLWVRESSAAADFPPLNRNQVAGARGESCQPKPLPRSQSDGLFVPVSSYAQEFRASQYKESWPTRFAQQVRAPAPMHGYTGTRPPKGNDIPLDKFKYGDVLVHGINA